MEQKKTSTYNPGTGESTFDHTPHHEEMLWDAENNNDAPDAVVINLADVTAMSQAYEAIAGIVYKPIF